MVIDWGILVTFVVIPAVVFGPVLLYRHWRSRRPPTSRSPECRHCEAALGKGLAIVTPHSGLICIWCLRDHYPDYYAALVNFTRQRPPRAEQKVAP